MDRLSRRSFLKHAAAGVAAVTLPSLLSRDALAAPVEAWEVAGSQTHFSRFGIDETLIRRVLSRAMERGGVRAELFFQHQVSRSLTLEDGRIDRASSTVDLGMGVRVVYGEQFGYAFSEDLSPESLLAAAATSAAIARGAAAVPPPHFGLPPRTDFYPIREGWEAVAANRKVPLLLRMDEVARRESTVRKVTAGLDDQAGWILIATSDGRLIEDYQPMTSASVSVVAERNGRREEGFYGFGARSGLEAYDEARLLRIAGEASHRALTLFDARRPDPGEMPVVLAAGSSGILLHEAIGHGMEADYNRKGISVYSERMGKRIAPSHVTVVDDATNPNARGSINCDDEGEPGQRTVLVENGVLRSYLHDSISARHYGVASTGSGRRQSFRHAPVPRMRNTYMLPGPHKAEEIIRNTKRGLYAVTFANGEVQIGAGDFTFYVKTGFLIEDGKLTAPVKDVNIIGNGPRCLERVDMVADDFALDDGKWTCGKAGQGVPVGLGLPTCRIKSVTVG